MSTPSDHAALTAALGTTGRGEVLAHFVTRLQEELLTYPDDLDGVDVAVGYRPAESAIGFGGDWYDVIPIDEHRSAFVVGDVAGHGVAAAAQMAQTKGVLRALIVSSEDLADVFPQATRTLSHLDTTFVATAAMAVLDRRACSLRWATAGHPPPILKEAGQPAELLWRRPFAPPIGLCERRERLGQRRLEPGSTIVLYTDGLVERRGAALDDRLEELRSRVDELSPGASAARMRDNILHGMVAAGASDDVAIVVVHLS